MQSYVVLAGPPVPDRDGPLAALPEIRPEAALVGARLPLVRKVEIRQISTYWIARKPLEGVPPMVEYTLG